MRNRKEREHGSRMTGDLFAPLIRQSDDIYVSLNSDMTIEYVSPSVERVLGYRPEEVTGKSGVLYILPEDLSRIGIHLLAADHDDGTEEAAASSVPHVAEVTEDYQANFGVRDIRVRHRDGRYIWCRATFSIVRDELGVVERIVAVGRDISDKKRSEEELRRSRAHLQLAHRIAGLGHFEWYPETNELYWSDEMYAVFGFSRTDFASDWEAYEKIVHPEDRPVLREYFVERLRETDQELKCEYRIFMPDGSVRTIQTIGKWMRDEYRQAPLLVGIVRDITIESRTEELLRTSEKLKMAGQLAAGIAHEIRNPLTSLKGFSKLLRKATGEQADRYYEIMDQEFVRIEMILGELLVLAKPQASVYQDWDIRLIVHEVADLLSSQAILNNVIIQEQATPEACIVRCDKNQLKQVFMNVVKNAIEAMPSGGLLIISIERDETDVLVHVIDQGSGIPEDQLRRLGEPFFTTKEKGTGLGLMISHKIIEEHDGNIRYVSRSGEGTTVSIRLPQSCAER
ncbi:PAS/PAC sensor signal transduction histidine kinase kinA [Thermobacillus xylanilyticus]|uniref:histidine kinase n=1 Tax=Thermobacillus xylanilyticus TaxID=76633 RepID=A0ABN7RZX5_THEXY|nr:PAS domain-containing protein [Thermobacillus xylanilyticus]CAG5085841.1 PAS/PAC sensor signal transduction histidine kinase kinA [Thermobacillus xylanilyticus]